MWRKNVLKHKNIIVAKELQKKYFLLNPIYRKTLLEYRSLTYELMSNHSFIGIDPMEHNDQGEINIEPIFTLSRFKTHQEYSRKKINAKIYSYS